MTRPVPLNWSYLITKLLDFYAYLPKLDHRFVIRWIDIPINDHRSFDSIREPATIARYVSLLTRRGNYCAKCSRITSLQAPHLFRARCNCIYCRYTIHEWGHRRCNVSLSRMRIDAVGPLGTALTSDYWCYVGKLLFAPTILWSLSTLETQIIMIETVRPKFTFAKRNRKINKRNKSYSKSIFSTISA
ncbi:unnamed protein product [Xylocopa violacea]|uniref:Uncharacterized protein n=1 Tax=Xylocopa violacea TaxID=135666 RepID=A0ABP1NWW1_XYLVO